MPDYVQPVVDVAALTTTLDGPHAELRQKLRRELVNYGWVLDAMPQRPRSELRQIVLDVVSEQAAAKMSGLGFPESYGGGADIGGSIAAFETLALGDLSVLVKTGVQFGLFGGAILHLGSAEHHEKYLTDIVSADLLGCFAMTETGHGSNVQALETTATYDADTGEFVVHTPSTQAGKDYIGNATCHGQLAVVFAQLIVAGVGQGVHALVVPLRDEQGETLPGVTIEDDGAKIGLNGVDNGRIWFDQVRVPRAALLNRYADVDEEGVYHSAIENPDRRFFTMLGTLVQGRVSIAGASVSVAKVALSVAVKYANRRRQFGAPGEPERLLFDYGMHQRRLLPRLAVTYAMHFAQDQLRAELDAVFAPTVSGAAEIDDGGQRSESEELRRRALESRAAGIKALATWMAVDTVQECREACGGAGYLAENRFAALKNDVDVFTTFEGANHILLQLVAKGLLTDYSSEFNELDQIGMVRMIAGMAADTVVEKTAVHKIYERIKDALPGGDESWDQDAGLLDPNYHRAMFSWREEHMLSSLARRLKAGIDAGHDSVDVFSRVQHHVISLGRAHAERLVVDSAIDAVEQMPASDNRVAVTMLIDLYALSTIEAERGWWMEHGRLSSQRAKAITAEVDRLCGRLRGIGEDLVDAFDIPAELLRAKIIAASGGPVRP